METLVDARLPRAWPGRALVERAFWASLDRIRDISKTGVENQSQIKATVNAAVRANVAFYPVDARGLTALPPGGDASQASPRGTAMLSGSNRILSGTMIFLFAKNRSFDPMGTVWFSSCGLNISQGEALQKQIRRY